MTNAIALIRIHYHTTLVVPVLEHSNLTVIVFFFEIQMLSCKYCMKCLFQFLGESSYNAHKAVLAACSEYFADVLDNDSKQLQVP